VTDIDMRVAVNAPAETTFAAMSDWPRQQEWMLGTKVRVTSGDGSSEGSELVAVTGVGPLAFADSMRITTWEPPLRCDVVHTGKLVRGTGEFLVRPTSATTSEFEWIEHLDLPFGVVGQLGWSLTGPAFQWGLRRSLNRFTRFAEGYRR
jgi:hypothetical protein